MLLHKIQLLPYCVYRMHAINHVLYSVLEPVDVVQHKLHKETGESARLRCLSDKTLPR